VKNVKITKSIRNAILLEARALYYARMCSKSYACPGLRDDALPTELEEHAVIYF
jgi:hypothetical protein